MLVENPYATSLVCGRMVAWRHESLFPQCFFQVPSPHFLSASSSSVTITVGLCPCLCCLLSAFQQKLWVFVRLDYPEAVNLVTHNRYHPHVFPSDQSGLFDNFIFLSMSAHGCPFPFVLCFGPLDSSACIDPVCPHALGLFTPVTLINSLWYLH